MTTEQKLARALDGLSHVLENARCIDTRRFVSRLLQDLDVGAATTSALSFRPNDRPREHVPSLAEIAEAS